MRMPTLIRVMLFYRRQCSAKSGCRWRPRRNCGMTERARSGSREDKGSASFAQGMFAMTWPPLGRGIGGWRGRLLAATFLALLAAAGAARVAAAQDDPF